MQPKTLKKNPTLKVKPNRSYNKLDKYLSFQHRSGFHGKEIKDQDSNPSGGNR